MTIAQLILNDFEQEMTSTRRLLERVPLDNEHRAFRPHEKSMPLDCLATHVAEAPVNLKWALDGDEFEFLPGLEPPPAASTAELLDRFDRSVSEARSSLERAPDEAMDRNWSLKVGGQTVLNEPRTRIVRLFLNHLLHHRAQLGVYLRLNGIAIPGMYGPSADEAHAGAPQTAAA